MNGLGFGHHLKLPQIMEAVTVQQTQEAAERFFGEDAAFVVRVKP
jgi:zinc protease